VKRILALLLVLMLAFSLTGCNDEPKAGKGELVLGENSFGVKVYVRNMTAEKVTFKVIPYGGEQQDGGQGEVQGPGGVFGTYGLVPGQKKGEKVELDGSFTLYAHNESGPSTVVTVKGSYALADLKNDFSTMYFFLYEDGKFIKSDKASVYK